LEDYKKQGYLVCFVGAAAKAIVFMNAAHIVPEVILDEAVLKIGKFIPGFATPVRPFQDIDSFTQPCLFVISAWNFRAEIEAKIRARLTRQEMKFLHYFPDIQVY